jgi:hypothetical protein
MVGVAVDSRAGVCAGLEIVVSDKPTTDEDEICRCAEPAPLALGAKCRKCHRWTVVSFNMNTGELRTIPSNQPRDAEEEVDANTLGQKREQFTHPNDVPRRVRETLRTVIADGRGESTPSWSSA